ncbi:unnamed protein product [Paramecium primaurelia]|uniref:Uncharacterized protein n=1 Tax=Paramecium primaurelia TaxID=5886 RepID=A0A8S1MTZ7_PARPR|nr:unnamed protein product [Paramecium primaurelia]
MELFIELTRQQLSDDCYIEFPKVCNEIGTKWLIGYNHIITIDEDYEKYKNGIRKEQAQDLLIQDINKYKIVLQYEYNEKYGEKTFQQLNLGCQYLLLSIFINSGRILQFSKLIYQCQQNNFYEALKSNGRNHINNENQNIKLNIKCQEEQQFFIEHFDEQGIPKQEGIWTIEIPQTNEEDLYYAQQILDDRFYTLGLCSIFAINTELEFCNYKSVLWLEFLKDQEGKKYNFVSYNQEQQKWFPVNVMDQEYQIIGYSHICNPTEVLAYQDGLTDGQVNYLFLADYDQNCLKVRRFLKQEYQNKDFDNLTSQVQLLLIDLSFRNWPLIYYKKSIDLALENKIQEAINQSYIYYIPCESVNSNYLIRKDEIYTFLNQISSTYQLKTENNNMFLENPNLNNIVGVKITEDNFSFILKEEAETKIQIEDLITFLKVYYDPIQQVDDITFSLEPEDNDEEMMRPFQNKIYSPEYLDRTNVGLVLYEADFLLKQMSLGIEVLEREPLITKPFVYGNLDIQPLYKLDPEYYARLFLKIGKLKLNILEDKHNNVHKLEIEKIDIAVEARILNQQLNEEVIQDENNGAQRFASQFTQLYDQIGQKYPIFIRLRQVLMANYLAKYMYEKGIPINYEFIENIFYQKLIPQEQLYRKSPTLKLYQEDEYHIIDLRGGIDSNSSQIDNIMKNALNHLDENQNLQVVETNSEIIDAKFQRCDSVSSISTQASFEVINELKKKEKCMNCKKDLEQCEIDQNKICKTCNNQKCSKCYKISNENLFKIQNEICCKECFKCYLCNKQNPNKIYDQKYYHQNCFEQAKKQFELKKQMISYIKKTFGTKQKQADNNEKQSYFQIEQYPFINIRDYTGYIIGYNHPIIKSQAQINLKQYKLPFKKAEELLIKDLEEFENQLNQFYKVQNYTRDNNFKMLMLFILFIFKNFDQVLNLANKSNYKDLFVEIPKLQIKNTKGVHVLRGKIEKALDFFKLHFDQNGNAIQNQEQKIKNT